MAVDIELGEIDQLSRVLLEPVLARQCALGYHVRDQVIRDELASRTWQNINPYAPET